MSNSFLFSKNVVFQYDANLSEIYAKPFFGPPHLTFHLQSSQSTPPIRTTRTVLRFDDMAPKRLGHRCHDSHDWINQEHMLQLLTDLFLNFTKIVNSAPSLTEICWKISRSALTTCLQMSMYSEVAPVFFWSVFFRPWAKMLLHMHMS